eukprot:comp22010_c0_seq1/m.50562 comp22010_c0_seq1/g.50562  ORF comp22010_c0_seq1/g.50562 comp22010_c0_seq1/m.50562 type:complete len:672 (-) comp22010_c0_seq1:171-2186(-)
MSGLVDESGALEFLSTCESRIQTSWSVTIAGKRDSNPAKLFFRSGNISGAGADAKGKFTWAGKLNVSGHATLSRTYEDGKSKMFNGRYDKEKNTISGFFSSRGENDVGEFSFALLVPEMSVSTSDDVDEVRKDAVNEYMAQRDKVINVALGTPGTDILTTWTALYVYGSGLSDTIKDVLLRVRGKDITGSGSDIAGAYTWKGTISGDQVSIIKEYKEHSIQHTGTFNATRDSIKGTWSIPGTRALGNFHLSEVVSRRINAESMDLHVDNLSLDEPNVPAASGALTPEVCVDTVWSVVYVYGSGRSDELKDCTLRFVKGQVMGSGEDPIGRYEWTGKLQANGQCDITKKYVGKHSVHHSGVYDGATQTLKGSWSVPNTRAVGGFKMVEKTDKRKTVLPKYYLPIGEFPEKMNCVFNFEHFQPNSDPLLLAGVVLRITGTTISGRGTDQAGECKWTGELVPASGSFKLVKSYKDRDITYSGTYSNQVLEGQFVVTGSKKEVLGQGQFKATESVIDRRASGSSENSAAAPRRDSLPPSQKMSYPNVDRASEAKPRPLPALTQVTGEVITFWKGYMAMGSQQGQIPEFSMSFSNGKEFSGTGKDDIIGDYTITGDIDPKTCKVNIRKMALKGGAGFEYTGEYDTSVSRIHGIYSMTGTRVKSEFELFEITEKRVG